MDRMQLSVVFRVCMHIYTFLRVYLCVCMLHKARWTKTIEKDFNVIY